LIIRSDRDEAIAFLKIISRRDCNIRSNPRPKEIHQVVLACSGEELFRVNDDCRLYPQFTTPSHVVELGYGVFAPEPAITILTFSSVEYCAASPVA
jgi:hypothetical protein